MLLADAQTNSGDGASNVPGKLAIDVINGGPLLRQWVDDAAATPRDLDMLALADEQAWLSERARHMRY